MRILTTVNLYVIATLSVHPHRASLPGVDIHSE